MSHWEQILRNLTEIIKAAVPHGHLYAGSKKANRGMAGRDRTFLVAYNDIL
jgi:hypothetical protein